MNRRDVLMSGAGVALAALMPKAIAAENVTATEPADEAADFNARSAEQMQEVWQNRCEAVQDLPVAAARRMAFEDAEAWDWARAQFPDSQGTARLAMTFQLFALYAHALNPGAASDWKLSMTHEDGQLYIGIRKPVSTKEV